MSNGGRIDIERRGRTMLAELEVSRRKALAGAVVDATFEGRLDKCHDFQRHTDVNRGFLRGKELDDFLEQVAVDVTSA
jgi:hypothetical protein